MEGALIFFQKLKKPGLFQKTEVLKQPQMLFTTGRA
jgi:hypothetical protein